MNSKKLFTGVASLCLAITVIISACKKNDDDNDNIIKVENTDYSTHNARMEQIMNDAINFTHQSYYAGFLNLKSTGVSAFSCATVIVDTANKSITIDFGQEYCLCKDARTRKGKIIRKYSGKFSDTGKNHTITFEDYYINKYKIDGTITVIHKGANSNGLPYFQVSSSLSYTNVDNNETTIRSSEGIRTVRNGDFSNDIYDDTYAIDGSGLLTIPNSAKYNYSIEQSININPNCDWPLQGIVEFRQVENGQARLFDYGTIGCDNKATLRVEGEIKAITLD